MKVAVIRIGQSKNGIDNYASQLGRQLVNDGAETEIVFVDVNGTSFVSLFNEVVCADSVLFQYSHHCYKGWVTKLKVFLLIFLVSVNKPVVTTFHDVYPLKLKSCFGSHKNILKALKAYIKQSIVKFSYAMVVLCSSKVVFLSEEEQVRMQSIISLGSKCQVIPHFIDVDSLRLSFQSVPSDFLRKRYGFSDREVVLSLVGVVHFRKGHHLVVELLSLLPSNYRLLIAGGAIEPSHEEYRQSLIERANLLGVGSKLVFSGYLSSKEYAAVLSQSDLGLAPFLDVSASGTLSDWMCSNVPVLSSSNHISERFQALSTSKIYMANFDQKLETASTIIQVIDTQELANVDFVSEFSLTTTADKYKRLLDFSG